MIRRPPRSTRTDTLCPSTTLFRSISSILAGSPVGAGIRPEGDAAMTRPIHLGHSRERGQALVESLVAMVVMLALYAAVSWLGRFQDMALQATHASRFAAFSLARNASLRPIAQIRRRYFSGPAHQWTASDGNPVLSDRQSEATLTVSPGQPLGPQALPGGTDSSAAALRHGLRLGGPGIRHAHVLLRFAGSDSGSTTADRKST